MGKTNNPQHTSTKHDRGINNDKSFSPDVLLHLDPLCTPLPKQQNNPFPTNQDTSLNLDIEKILHFKRASYLKQYRDQTKCFFSKSKKA